MRSHSFPDIDPEFHRSVSRALRRGIRGIGLLLATVVMVACGSAEPGTGAASGPSVSSPPTAPATFAIDPGEVDRYDTAYIAAVVADPAGPDVVAGAGEHVVLASNFELETDLGGWAITDDDGNRLALPPSTKLPTGQRLRVYVASGTDSDEAVYAGLGGEVLEDDGDTLVLRDAGGNEVARLTYGD